MCKQLNSTPAAGCQRLAVDSNTQTTDTNLNTPNLSENLNLVTIRQNLSDNSQQTTPFVVNDKSLGFNSKAVMISTDDVDDMPNHLRYHDDWRISGTFCLYLQVWVSFLYL